MRRTPPWLTVVYGGLTAGTLDIVFAITFWAVKADVPATRILQSIAGGLLGKASYAGGVRTAALGLALHYFIAISMSVAWFRVAAFWTRLRVQPVPFGIAYGLLLYGIMNHVIVPLSAAGPGSKNPLWITMSIAVHMFLIGLPIALFARRAYQD
jgi:hypothetical protein